MTMKRVLLSLLSLCAVGKEAFSFSIPGGLTHSTALWGNKVHADDKDRLQCDVALVDGVFQGSLNRRKVVGVGTAGIIGLISIGPGGFGVENAEATGRATLEQAADRYIPRIISGGETYKTDLYKAIASGSSAALYAIVKEPRAKEKSDNSKSDGGFSERAVSAGSFSDARVLNAMDLYASTFSDRSTSLKTKSMKIEVSKLREVVKELEGMGKNEKKFDVKRAKDIYKKGGDAFNKYCFLANEGLNVKMKRLPYL